jgi:hypothetical protein
MTYGAELDDIDAIVLLRGNTFVADSRMAKKGQWSISISTIRMA